MNTVLAIAAHPDDIEFLMGGTLMLLADVGYQVHYWNLSNGSCGTAEHDRDTIVEIRRVEAQAAAEYLGAVFHESICDDLAIFYDGPTLAKVAATVRQVAPKILLTQAPVDYMEDHMNTCRLAVTAAFARGMRNFPVDPPTLPTANKITVYHAQPFSHRDPLRQLVEPDLYVDVTGVIERKVKLLSQHISQKKWLDQSQGHDSYLTTLRQFDQQCGHMCDQFQYAEGWRRHLHLGYCDPDDDPLTIALRHKIFAPETSPRKTE